MKPMQYIHSTDSYGYDISSKGVSGGISGIPKEPLTSPGARRNSL
jgi:hypothetical protein